MSLSETIAKARSRYLPRPCGRGTADQAVERQRGAVRGADPGRCRVRHSPPVDVLGLRAVRPGRAGLRIRPDGHRADGRHDRRRDRSVDRIDLCPVRADDPHLAQRLQPAARRGGRPDAAGRGGLRRDQRHSDRLSEAQGVPDHAGHADHVPVGLRDHPAGLRDQDRAGHCRTRRSGRRWAWARSGVCPTRSSSRP